MKPILYKILLLALIIPGVSFCSGNPNDDFFGKHTREKKIKKEFEVSANSNLKIENSYGNVDISTWDQNRVVIEVNIKTNGSDAEKVERKLEEIHIEFNQSASGVSAKTNLSRENRSWWDMLFGGGSNINMEINYTVRAPATNNLDLSNDYGGIFIDKLLGNSRISCDYGRFDIGELRGDSNILEFDYTRNSHIGYVKNARIDADYSDYTIEDAGNLKVNADYTSGKILKVENLEFNCDYGSIAVDKVRRLKGNGDYLSTKIGRIFGSADLELDYGRAEIEKIVKGAGNIRINTDYAGVKIGYDPTHAFRFNINASYGSVKGLEDFNIEKRKEENTRKSFSGYNLNETSGSNVEITSSYAGIEFISR